jgi:hypothetical protein
VSIHPNVQPPTWRARYLTLFGTSLTNSQAIRRNLQSLISAQRSTRLTTYTTSYPKMQWAEFQAVRIWNLSCKLLINFWLIKHFYCTCHLHSCMSNPYRLNMLPYGNTLYSRGLMHEANTCIWYFILPRGTIMVFQITTRFCDTKSCCFQKWMIRTNNSVLKNSDKAKT